MEIDSILNVPENKLSIQRLMDLRNKNFEKYKKAIEKGKKIAQMKLKIGDKVLIYKEPLKNKFSQKWWPGYIS